MKWDFELTRLAEAKTALKTLVLITGGLLISNVMLTLMLFTREEHWILIPQFDLNHEFEVKRSSWSDDYLIRWADGILLHFLTVSPETVHHRHADLLKLASHGRGELDNLLKKEQKRVLEDNMSLSFYPKRFEVDRSKKEVHVTGTLSIYLGRDRQPIVKDKQYSVGFERGPHGVILLDHLKQHGEEDHEKK